MDRGVCWATVLQVAKSQTQLSMQTPIRLRFRVSLIGLIQGADVKENPNHISPSNDFLFLFFFFLGNHLRPISVFRCTDARRNDA